jgi:hypothetical protein
MNYADNDDIYNEIVRIGQGKFTDEQIYQIAYMVICARLQGRDSAFIDGNQFAYNTQPKRYRREK